MKGLVDLGIGLGLGILAHDLAVHDYTFPMDRMHGWHVGAAIAGTALILKYVKGEGEDGEEEE